MTVRIQLRGDTAANWTSINPILAVREIGIETDTHKLKIGDGAARWLALLYVAGDTTQIQSLISAQHSLDLGMFLPTANPIPLANLATGATITVFKTAGVWPTRPTTRTDVIVQWVGPDPSPAIGVGAMMSNVDLRIVTP